MVAGERRLGSHRRAGVQYASFCYQKQLTWPLLTDNRKAGRGEALTSAPALTRAKQELETQMTQADSVHSTPRTNTSAIGAKFRRLMNYPVEPLPLVAVLIGCVGSILVHLLIAVMP